MIHPNDDDYITFRAWQRKNWQQLRAVFMGICAVLLIANLVEAFK